MIAVAQSPTDCHGFDNSNMHCCCVFFSLFQVLLFMEVTTCWNTVSSKVTKYGLQENINCIIKWMFIFLQPRYWPHLPCLKKKYHCGNNGSLSSLKASLFLKKKTIDLTGQSRKKPLLNKGRWKHFILLCCLFLCKNVLFCFHCSPHEQWKSWMFSATRGHYNAKEKWSREHLWKQR